jgi:hypothetical protein
MLVATRRQHLLPVPYRASGPAQYGTVALLHKQPQLQQHALRGGEQNNKDLASQALTCVDRCGQTTG